MSEDRATVLNYGGGTQTVALCVLIARGVLPKPDHIVMADTSREVLSTFRYLDEHTRPFMKTHGLSIEVAPHSLATVDLYSHKGTLLIPAFTQTGKFSSYCSGEWKASVVERYLRSKGVKRAEQWIGYSLDEKKRWSAPRDKSGPWVLRFPLVELLATRDDCERIITEAGLPLPHKSRCWMCPNQSNAEWRELRDKSPEEFAAAVRLDEQIREEDEEHGFYVHESRQPLSVANIDVPDRKTKERRCTLGMCFV